MVLAVLAFSCGTMPKEFRRIEGVAPKSQNPDCIDIFNKISKNWSKHMNSELDENCFYYNENLIASIIQNKSCFIGLTEIELLNLLGVPSNKDTVSYNIHYFLSKRCSSNFSTGEHHLRFSIKDTVVDLDYYLISRIN